ncbi:MAG: exonuclease domain-containing protein [Bacteroidia bacterium]|nr:exonuclease domain-containing protein [Bacteroidia bacterium]
MILFFDLEFTCDENSLITNWSNPELPPEIIEIGLVCYDKKKVRDTFKTFVRPVINSKLSSYCIKLTGINSSDIDKAESLADVNFKISEWLSCLNITNSYSWGKEDLLFWENDSKKQYSSCPLNPENYIDLMRLAAQKIYKLDKVCERETIRKKLHISGTHHHNHTAISDAFDLISLYEGITNFNHD